MFFLAGKFEPICRVSPTTYSARILTRLPLLILAKKVKNLTASRAKISWRVIAISFPLKKKKTKNHKHSLESFALLRFLQKKFWLDVYIFQLYFFFLYTLILCTSWRVEVPNERAPWKTIDCSIKNTNSKFVLNLF